MCCDRQRLSCGNAGWVVSSAFGGCKQVLVGGERGSHHLWPGPDLPGPTAPPTQRPSHAWAWTRLGGSLTVSEAREGTRETKLDSR